MTSHDPPLRDALTWAASHPKASKELKRDAQRALRLLDDANLLHATIVNDNAASVAGLRDAEQTALQLLCDKPTRDNARAVVELQRQNDDATQLQLRETRAAERAAAHARTACGRVFSDQVLALVQLVAVDRCDDITACGSDAVLPVLRDVWRRLNFAWHPHVDDPLMLPPQFHQGSALAHHLPLTWHAVDPATYRASLAWWWQQLAAGNFEMVARPLTRIERQRGVQPGTRGTCVRITTTVDVLPAVPSAVARKQPYVHTTHTHLPRT